MCFAYLTIPAVQTVGHADLFQDPEGNWYAQKRSEILNKMLTDAGGALLCQHGQAPSM